MRKFSIRRKDKTLSFSDVGWGIKVQGDSADIPFTISLGPVDKMGLLEFLMNTEEEKNIIDGKNEEL